MSTALQIVAFICTLTMFCQAGVTVSSPTSGRQDSSSLHFVASASGSHPMIAMKIHSDGNVMYPMPTEQIISHNNEYATQ